MARVTSLEVVRTLTPDERFEAYLAAADDDIVACKAARHNIPKLKPGNLPPGSVVRRRRGGVYQVWVECLDCGLPCTVITGKGGVLEPDEHWEYDYSAKPGYLAPKGTGRGRKREYVAELGRRVAPDIRQAAAVTAAQDAAAKRIVAASKAAKTPKVHNPGNQHGTNPRARRTARDGERRMAAERQQQHPGSTA